MSTVTIRAEVDPPPGGTLGMTRPALLFIDGVRIDAESINVSWKQGVPFGDFTLEVNGVPIMIDAPPPPRRYLDGEDAGMVEWTWRNVALEVRG